MAVFTNTATATFLAGLLPVIKVSNAVTAVLASDDFTLTKSQSQTVLFPSTTQTYTVTGVNGTGIALTNFVLTDTIPLGLNFVTGSFTVDGTVVTPTYNALTRILSYNFGAWAVGATHVFSFQCKPTSVE